MDLLQKSKYSHLRNESVSSLEEALGGLGVPASPVESLADPQSLPASPSSSSLGLAAPLGELSPESEDSPTTLCSFFPKMANLKLSNPANLLSLRGSSAGGSPGEPGPAGTPAPASVGAAGPGSAGPVAVCSQDMNKLSCGKKTRVEGGQLGGDEWTRHGSFVNKPTRGWLHPDDKVMGPGVSYHVRVSAGGLREGVRRGSGRSCRAPRVGGGIPGEVTAAEQGGLAAPAPRADPALSPPVHGLRGSPAVHEGFGFQHPDAGHQVSAASPRGLPLFGGGCPCGAVGGARLPAAVSDNTSAFPPREGPRPCRPRVFRLSPCPCCGGPRVLGLVVGGVTRGRGGPALGADTPLCSRREAIGLVCEAVPGAKGAVRRRKVRPGRGAAGGSGLGAEGQILAQPAVPELGSPGL